MLGLSAWEHWEAFTLEELAGRSALDKSGLKHTAEKLAERKILVRLNENLYIHRQEMDFYRKRAEAVLDEFHKANPLKEGMGIEELRKQDESLQTGACRRYSFGTKTEKVIKEEHGLISKSVFG